MLDGAVRARPTSAGRALVDLREGARLWELWSALALLDVRIRFRRSILGPFWITLSFGLMIVVLGSVYAHVLKESVVSFLPYLAAGLLAWNFIAATIRDSCAAFTDESGALWQSNVPRSICVYRLLCRNLILAALNVPIVVVVMIACGAGVGPGIVWLAPALLLLITNLLWLGFVLALVTTAWRDTGRLVGLVLQFGLLVTPIIWRVEQVPALAWFATANPLYHAVELVRAPLLSQPVPATTWAISLFALGVGTAGAFALFSALRWRITYWL
jgi:ABC-2 type transport system permease protein/lipopolysaccharide transport system permease protein